MTMIRTGIAMTMVLMVMTACTNGPAKDTSVAMAKAPTAAQLQGSEWVLESIAGVPVLADAKPTLAFGNEDGISGFASCNRYFGPGTITADGSLDIGKLNAMASTMMMCSPEQMTQEQSFLAAIAGANKMMLDGDHLSIQSSALTKPLMFVRMK